MLEIINRVKNAPMIALLLAGFSAIVFLVSCRDDAVQFTAVAPVRRDLTATVTATGTVFPIVEVLVGSQVSGRIEKLFVDFNDPVKKGTPLARIDPSTFQAKVDEAQAQIAHARANIRHQKTTLQRLERLYADKIAPLADLESARIKLTLAEADLQQAIATYNQARVDLTNTIIRSPMDGIVTSRNVEEGQTVAASLSAPTLFSIADSLSHLWVIGNVDEADVGQVVEKQPVTFTIDAFPSVIFPGTVKLIRNRPITIQGVVTFETVIEVENPKQKLRPGMTANISFVVSEKRNVLTIPNAALRFRPPERFLESSPSATADAGQNQPAGGRGKKPPKAAKSHTTIWILKGKTPVAVKIRTGISDGSSTEVREGLREDSRVIVGSTIPGATSPAAANPFAPGPAKKLP